MAPAPRSRRLQCPVVVAVAAVAGVAAQLSQGDASVAAAAKSLGPRHTPLLQRRGSHRVVPAAAAEEAGSGSGLPRRRAAALLGASFRASVAESVRASSAAAAASERTAGNHAAASSQADPRLSAGFFDAFSDGESTYDEDGDLGRRASQAGWEPGMRKPGGMGSVTPEWFHESHSGGPTAAWQTHYPALKTDLTGHGTGGAHWVENAEGQYVQPHTSSYNDERSTLEGDPFSIRKDGQEIPPGFFDESVAQYDSFGRRQVPDRGSARALVNWQELSVNTSLSCDSPGCTASVLLQAFNGKQQLGRHCRLNVDAQHYSGDSIEWISVNGANISSRCSVPANKCDSADTDTRSLYPCVLELDLDKLISLTGTLDVSAKISQNASASCTYQGHLLSMVPMVTCMVKDIPASSLDVEDAALPSATAAAAT